METLHNKKAAILTEQRALLANCQDCIKATVQSVLSTIQSADNANILYVRSAVESTLQAATENQYLLLEPESQFVPEFKRCDERRLQRVVDALNNVGVVVDKSTCAETTTAAGLGLERANRGRWRLSTSLLVMLKGSRVLLVATLLLWSLNKTNLTNQKIKLPLMFRTKEMEIIW